MKYMACHRFTYGLGLSGSYLNLEFPGTPGTESNSRHFPPKYFHVLHRSRVDSVLRFETGFVSLSVLEKRKPLPGTTSHSKVSSKTFECEVILNTRPQIFPRRITSPTQIILDNGSNSKESYKSSCTSGRLTRWMMRRPHPFGDRRVFFGIPWNEDFVG